MHVWWREQSLAVCERHLAAAAGPGLGDGSPQMTLGTFRLHQGITSLTTSLRSKTMRAVISHLTLLLYSFGHSLCSSHSCSSLTRPPAVSHALRREQQACSVGDETRTQGVRGASTYLLFLCLPSAEPCQMGTGFPHSFPNSARTMDSIFSSRVRHSTGGFEHSFCGFQSRGERKDAQGRAVVRNLK